MERQIGPLWQELGSGPKGKVPQVVYTIVEVPKGSREKYELDKESGILFLDRDLFGSMTFPGDYGIIPRTLCKDGDPVDVLLLVSHPHHPGIVIPSRPIGLFKMTDEKGEDNKVLCVPDYSVDPSFANIENIKDISKYTIAEIQNFFEHYKELEPGKWVKIKGRQGKEEAEEFILESMAMYNKNVGVKD